MQSTEERFWSKVNRTETCWLWTASRNASGYGQFMFQGRPHRSHRMAYEMFVGPVPDGLVLDHLCRVRACCNPAHLDPVPDEVNRQRGKRGGSHNRQKTHCPQGHAYDAENTYLAASGRRHCKECSREATRRSRLRAKLGLPSVSRATHCQRGHEYTAGNTYWSPDGSRRICRACRNLNQRSLRFEQD